MTDLLIKLSPPVFAGPQPQPPSSSSVLVPPKKPEVVFRAPGGAGQLFRNTEMRHSRSEDLLGPPASARGPSPPPPPVGLVAAAASEDDLVAASALSSGAQRHRHQGGKCGGLLGPPGPIADRLDPEDSIRDIVTENDLYRFVLFKRHYDKYMALAARYEEARGLAYYLEERYHEVKSVAEDKNEGIDTDIDFDFDDQASENESESEDVENVDYNNTNQVFDIENIDIKTILESTFEGRQILSWHKAKNFLNQGQRKRLVHFVIAGVLNICNRELKGDDFKVLSRKIVETFPKECELVYYEAGIPKRKSNTGFSKKPKGKLLWKYINIKKISKELKASKKDKKKVFNVKNLTEIETSQEIKDSIEWLKNQEEPWEEAEQHWQITANYRRTQIVTGFQKRISSIYEEWPILKCPKGYQLIVQDFSVNKFTSDENSIKNFNSFFNKALQVRVLKKDDHYDLLKSLLEKEDLKEDDGTLIRLMLLCGTLPSVARIPQGKRKVWKPSAVESLEGIVTRIKAERDKLEETRQQLEKRLEGCEAELKDKEEELFLQLERSLRLEDEVERARQEREACILARERLEREQAAALRQLQIQAAQNEVTRRTLERARQEVVRHATVIRSERDALERENEALKEKLRAERDELGAERRRNEEGVAALSHEAATLRHAARHLRAAALHATSCRRRRRCSVCLYARRAFQDVDDYRDDGKLFKCLQAPLQDLRTWLRPSTPATLPPLRTSSPLDAGIGYIDDSGTSSEDEAYSNAPANEVSLSSTASSAPATARAFSSDSGFSSETGDRRSRSYECGGSSRKISESSASEPGDAASQQQQQQQHQRPQGGSGVTRSRWTSSFRRLLGRRSKPKSGSAAAATTTTTTTTTTVAPPT